MCPLKTITKLKMLGRLRELLPPGEGSVDGRVEFCGSQLLRNSMEVSYQGMLHNLWHACC